MSVVVDGTLDQIGDRHGRGRLPLAPFERIHAMLETMKTTAIEARLRETVADLVGQLVEALVRRIDAHTEELAR